MAIYNETQGYQELDPNPLLGDPEDIEALNKRHASGEGEPSLQDLLHTREQIQYQMQDGKVPEDGPAYATRTLGRGEFANRQV
jgi:hypothetical protein